jgi:hypothetical protein
MKPKGKLEVPAPSPDELRSQCQRQTSDKESDEVRKHGCNVVLPSMEWTQWEDWRDWIF